MTTNLRGKCSWFGGPDDLGVSASEGLAFVYNYDMAPHLFLDQQPPGTSGLARRLDPEVFYIACRWNYDAPDESKTDLLEHTALVRSPRTGKQFVAFPSDWGPHSDTDRVADISPGLMTALGIQTDDEVEVTYPYDEQEEATMPYKRICISSGHGKYVQGAVGPSPWGLNEVNEARRVVDQLASVLTASGVTVMKFADDVSKNQSDNLTRIVDWHNSQTRDLDISVHFNAFEPTPSGRGTEVLYKTQADLAGEMSAAIAAAGFIDRGAKKRDDLKFLNSTEMPAILIETCFVDSEADVRIYKEMFEEICDAIAWVLCDAAPGTTPPPVEPVEPGDKPIITISIDAPDGVDIAVRINGVDVLLGDE